jgi:hypothetical protein
MFKLCLNYDKYINTKIKFKYSNVNIYPIMYLDDIEIHWIYEKNEEEILNKFLKRKDLYIKNKPILIFIWSDYDMLNNNINSNIQKTKKESIELFTYIPNSYYFTSNKEYIYI